MISERRRGDVLPTSVRPGETVRGVNVIEFDWDPVRKLPDYTLAISDGRREFTAPAGLRRRRGQRPAEHLKRPVEALVHHVACGRSATKSNRAVFAKPPSGPASSARRLVIEAIYSL